MKIFEAKTEKSSKKNQFLNTKQKRNSHLTTGEKIRWKITISARPHNYQ